MNETITLPSALPAGQDWNDTLQKIVAYGSGRLFDSLAVERIYKSNPTPINSLGDDVYTAGQTAVKTVGQTLGGINPLFLIAGLVIIVFALKD